MSVALRRMTRAAAAAVLAGRAPDGLALAADYPTEFSLGVAREAGGDSALGPYLVEEDGIVVGEIGGAAIGPGTVMIGYAIVPSRRGRGIATAAVGALLETARGLPDVERVVAHTPLDRPASARVLEKAGFTCTGEIDDEHEGRPLRVRRWERAP